MCPDDWIEAVLDSPENTGERDRLRDPIENLQWDLTKEYLKKGLTVILENGFWAEEERSQYSMEALDLGAKIELIYVEAPTFEALWARVEKRNNELPSKVFVMTPEELQAGFKVFQPPTDEEMAFYDDSRVVRGW